MVTMFNENVVVLIADDDEGHVVLLKKNLRRSGIENRIIDFPDGQEILDFLFRRGKGPGREDGVPYLLLLDIRMPKVDGIQVLRSIKGDEDLRILPVIMVTTTDHPEEVELCHELGCNTYVKKPVIYDEFVEAVQRLGSFIQIVQIPVLGHDP
jgi:CheY-like chemotaxis protein